MMINKQRFGWGENEHWMERECVAAPDMEASEAF